MNKKRNYDETVDVSNKKVRNEDTNPFANFPTFEKLQDSIDYGKEYEQSVCGLYALKLSTDEDDVFDFEMTSNNKAYGVFDDVELRVTFNDKKRTEKTYLFQLKHKVGEKPITKAELTAADKKKPFCLRKYLDSLLKIEIEDATGILYTNTSAHISPGMCLTDGSNYKILVKAANVEYGNILNTKVNAIYPFAFRFKFEGNSRKTFYFFTQQDNIHEIKSKIENFLKNLTQVDIYELFALFMNEWWSKNFVLTKHDFITKLTELACLPYIRTISGEKCNEKSEEIVKIIKKFHITLVEEDEERIVEKIWAEAEKEFDFNVAMKKYGLTASEPSPMHKSILLWHLGLVPLVISYEESNKNIIKCIIDLLARSWGRKNIVLVGNFGKNELHKHKILVNLSDINTSENKIDNITKNFRISFQGRQPVTLATVPNIASILGVRELLKMSQKEFLVVEPPKQSFNQFYIPRILSSTFININVLLALYKNVDNCLIIIKCEEGQKRRLLNFGNFDTLDFSTYLHTETQERCDSSVLLLYTESISVSNFDQLCKKAKHSEIYILEVVDDECCRVLFKYGNTFLSKKILQNERFIEEENIFDTFKNSLNLICAPPGVGKSLLFQNISSKCPSEFWSIHVTLISQKQFFRTRPTLEKMLDHFLGLDYNQGDFASKIKKNWPKSKFKFFLDGLDEIDLASVTLVLNFAKFMSAESSTVWISVRENLRIFVSNYLGVVPIEIRKFSQKDQEQYINERLKIRFESKEIEKIIRAIFESADITNSQQLLGVSLQLYIITEMLLNNDEVYDKLNDENMFVLTKMYKLFFDGKKKFSLKKLGVDDYELGFSFDHHLKLYQLPALQTCLEESDFTILDLKTKKMKPFLDQIKTSGDKYGIIREVFGENQTIFVHQTYAEYFTCLWLKKHPKKVSLLRDAIFSEKYQNLRLIFDIMGAEDNPLHLAVIYKNVDQIEKHLKFLTDLDEYGRSVLHLLFSHGMSCPISKLQRLGRENKVYVAIFETLLTSCDKSLMYRVDTLFKFNCFDYALAAQCLFSLEKVLEKGMVTYEDLGKLLDDNTYVNLLAYYCSQLGYSHLLSVIIRKNPGVVKERFEKLSLLHAAVLGSVDDTGVRLGQENIEVIKILTETGCPLDSNYDTNILDYAFQNGNYGVLKTLSDLGARCNGGNTILHQITEYDVIDQRVFNLVQLLDIDINTRNDQGMTALHIACKNQNVENVTRLLDLDVEINTVDDQNRNALHYAVCVPPEENTEIVDLLIQKNIKIDACDDSGSTALQIACFGGNYETMKKLLHQGANPNNLANYKSNALSFAIHSFHNNSQIIDLLIEFGLDINARTQDRSTILHHACNIGSVQIVRKLLTLGVDILAVDDYDMNALHYAAEQSEDRTEVIQLLVEKGISVNSQDKDGRTALHMACQQERIDNIKILLHCGADANIVDTNCATVFHYAAQGLNDNSKILKELLQLNFDVNAKDSQGRAPIHFACECAIWANVQEILKYKTDVNTVDLTQKNVLHYAAQALENNVGLLELLTTEYGFDINAKTDKGQTPLHLSCEYGPVENAEAILRLGADVNADDNDGMNALHYATKSKRKNKALITLIINKKLNVNSKTKNGRSPLHLACLGYHVDIVQVLLDSGSDVDAIDDDGKNVLHYACQGDRENTKIINLLISKGLEVDTKDSKGRTPLHFASYSQGINNFQLLLRRNADVNVIDSDGMSVLHYAALSPYENLKIINYLLSTVGFDVNVCNREGETPLHLACQVGNVMNIEAFLKRGADINKLTSAGKDIRYYGTMSENCEIVLEEVLSSLQFLNL